MPLYEFHCRKCDRESEVLVRSTDWSDTACPHCGSTRLEKKLSVFASAGATEEPLPQCTGNPGACGRCSS